MFREENVADISTPKEPSKASKTDDLSVIAETLSNLGLEWDTELDLQEALNRIDSVFDDIDETIDDLGTVISELTS